jgi:biopolymer transport protein ExbD
MAELNNAAGGASTPRKIRSKKLGSKVDLTAMVDLAFLLITFFMLTTSLSKPKAMDLTMPDSKGPSMPVDQNRTMTVLIVDGNKAKCFMGKDADASKEISLGTKDLRRELSIRKKQVLDYMTAKGTPEKGLIVLIKPGKRSNYGNLVDILDEMAISGVPTYAIVDADPEEMELMKK